MQAEGQAVIQKMGEYNFSGQRCTIEADVIRLWCGNLRFADISFFLRVFRNRPILIPLSRSFNGWDGMTANLIFWKSSNDPTLLKERCLILGVSGWTPGDW
jgi:hypothetical protein